MRRLGHKGRTDANQDEIVKALRAIGCSVAITSSLGEGFPDLVVGRHSTNYLLEVKDGSNSPSKRLLTADELKFCNAWRGQWAAVYDVQSAMKVVNE